MVSAVRCLVLVAAICLLQQVTLAQPNEACDGFIKEKEIFEGQVRPEEQPDKLFRHVPSFNLRKGITDEEIQDIVDAFIALKEKIPVIKEFSYGKEVSVEGFNVAGGLFCPPAEDAPEVLSSRGDKQDPLQLVFYITFESFSDFYDVYLDCPAHVEFLEKDLFPNVNSLVVVDYFETVGF